MAERNKIVINGSLASGAEQWSCGIHYAADPTFSFVDTPLALQEWADDAMFLLQGGSLATTTLRNMLGETGAIENVTAYYYPPSGPATAVGVSTLPAIEGSGTPSKPAQCAVAVTLSTGVAGRSFRGRFYWPAVNIGMGEDLRLTTIAQTTIANEIGPLISEIGNVATGLPEFRPVVYSAVRNLTTPVVSAQVGNVIDTQRRRRENLTESYVTVDIA